MTESRYSEHAPTPALADRVSSVWCQRISAGAQPYRQRVVPDGSADVLWHNGTLVVAGPDTAWRMVRQAPGSTTVGIRFRPGAAGVLFGDVPVHEARDGMTDLADLWGTRPVRELIEQLGELEQASEIALLLQQAVIVRLSHVDDVDPVVAESVALFDTQRPPPIPDVADRFGLSERQFRRRFVSAVGYGPKTLTSVLRLGRAMRRLYDPRHRAADVAIAAGYADQPHMTRDMRRLAGITPGELAAG
ncbi:MAG TPA: AraC family transcriptional regulator [Pseudonocardiaceae bacterium]|nr:AraC family transcriptional regulator [Pseudonocardiaceae bacterium]